MIFEVYNFAAHAPTRALRARINIFDLLPLPLPLFTDPGPQIPIISVKKKVPFELLNYISPLDPDPTLVGQYGAAYDGTGIN